MRRRRRRRTTTTTTTIVIITIYIYIHPSIPKPPQRHHRKWCAAEIGSRADRALARPSASHGTQIIVKYNDIDSVSQDYSMPMSLSIYIYIHSNICIYNNIHPILLSTNYNEKLSDIAGCFVQHISRKIGKLMDFLFWGRNLIKSLNLYGWYQSPPIGLVEPPATFFEPWLSMNI